MILLTPSQLPNTLGTLWAGSTGLLSGLSAGDDVFALLSGGQSLYALSWQWTTVTGPTAQQEVGFHAIKATAWTTANSGGNVVTGLELGADTGNMAARISDTAALVRGVYVAGGAIGGSSVTELAAGAAVPVGSASWAMGGKIVLPDETGIVLRASIAMGAGLTGRLWVRALGGNF
jgi:hypothetical protein